MLKRISVFICLLLIGSQSVFASPTGLNNIPTTDVVSDRVLVLQSWLTTGFEQKPQWVSGAKYGLFDKVEIGIDSKLGSGDAGPIAFQGKLKVYEHNFEKEFFSEFAALIGCEGIALDENIGDIVTPYMVLSQDFTLLRVNAGYGFQKNNFGVFIGIDRSFSILEQDLILRSDLKQVNDGDDLLISVGFLLTLPFDFVWESWLSIPTKSGDEESVTLKLNYVITF